MRFIFKTLGIVIALMCTYTIFLNFFKVKASYFSSLQENQVRAEEFFFKENKYDVIIVGSSLSQGFSLKGINSHDLNFIGGGSITGLELIKRKTHLPKAIVIETNWIERPLDEDLTRTIFNPFYSKLLTYTAFLREKNHPINVLTGQLSSVKNYIIEDKAMSYAPFYMNLNVIQDKKQLNLKNIEKGAKTVSEYVHYFQNKGVKIYLMEIPVHPNIYQTPRSIESRNAVRTFLKDIPMISNYPNPNLLQTYDGCHMIESSRVKYSNHLANFLIEHQNDWDR